MVPALFEAGWLGIIQGLSAVLPVSGDGHLALGALLFDLRAADLELRVALYTGTLVATVVVLRAELFAAVQQGLRGVVHPSRLRHTTGGENALAVLLATAPTAAIGLVLRPHVEGWAASPLVIGTGFLLTTAALLSARWIRPGTLDAPGVGVYLLLGVAQGLAIVPGLSRSAVTLCLALWMGARPGRAFELSMLVSLPAIAGALALCVPEVTLGTAELIPLVTAAALSLISGALALAVLRRAVDAGHLFWFALWTFPLGLATLAMARAWPG